MCSQFGLQSKQGLRLYTSGRALAQHSWTSQFNSQHWKKKLGRTGCTWKCSQWSLNDGPSFFLLLSENIHFFKESTQLPTAPLLALGVCAHNCLQGYFKHESQTLGWPKEDCSRWSFYQFQPNTSHLSQSGFYYQVLAQNDSLSHDATSWSRETQLYRGSPPPSWSTEKQVEMTHLSQVSSVMPREARYQWAVRYSPLYLGRRSQTAVFNFLSILAILRTHDF